MVTMNAFVLALTMLLAGAPEPATTPATAPEKAAVPAPNPALPPDAGTPGARDYTPEGRQSNPFLHMGLHLAVRDQIATDRPAGLRKAFESLAQRTGSAHEAEHRIIECLAEAMWEAQRSGRPPDEVAYLQRVLRL